MSYKIYSYPGNKRVAKATIAAAYVGVKIEEPAFQMGVDNKTPEFLKKNPLGKIPVLEVEGKGCIFESNAIARYVAKLGKGGLYPEDPFLAGQVEQWIDFSVGEIDLPKAAWLYPIFGYIAENADATKKAKGDIRAALGVLNSHLADKTWLVGERVTLADIVVAMSLIDLYLTVIDTGFRKSFTHANRWFLTVVNQPQAKAVLGEVQLATKMAQAPKSAKPAAKKQEKKSEPKKKADKQAEPAAAPAAAAPAAAKPKKEKNPLDLLPKSATFDLEEWKRQYSNNDTRTAAIPWFWEHFDPEGYCIYFATYKYNDENKIGFQTSNLIGGWLQRLDPLRKYGFGSLGIFGDEDKDGETFEIHTVWVFRGGEVPFEMKDNIDSEYYAFTKVDLGDAKQKALVEDLFAWDGKFEGLTTKSFYDGKTFK